MEFPPTPHQPRGVLAVAGLLAAGAFALGGSARPEVASLEILRPLAAVALGIGLFNVRRAHVRNYRAPLAIGLACVALVIFQLAPLPGDAASDLAGRDLVAEIDAAAGLGSAWRPASLWPPATQNALWALLVPLSLLIICIQLAAADLVRLLVLVLVAGAVSAAQPPGRLPGMPDTPDLCRSAAAQR